MINRLFVNMYTNVGANVQDTSSGMATIIKNYLNDIYFDVLRRTNWEVTDPDYSFITIAGQQDYVLPSNFGKEMSVTDNTNKITIKPITQQQLAEDYTTQLSSQGTVGRYSIINRPVRLQPTSSSTVSLVSSSVLDSTQTVRIRGEISNGTMIEESLTLNGTTPVVSSNVYTKVRNIAKSSTTIGYVTVTSNSGAVVVAILAPADLSYLVKIIRLNQIPSNALTILMPYVIDPYPMVSDFDQPIINTGDILELGATMKSWRYKRQFDKALEYEKQYEKGIASLIWEMANTTNRTQLFHPTPYDRDDV